MMTEDKLKEINNLKEIYSMGFISQAEYESRLVALGEVLNEKEPENNHGGGSTDYSNTTSNNLYDAPNYNTDNYTNTDTSNAYTNTYANNDSYNFVYSADTTDSTYANDTTTSASWGNNDSNTYHQATNEYSYATNDTTTPAHWESNNFNSHHQATNEYPYTTHDIPEVNHVEEFVSPQTQTTPISTDNKDQSATINNKDQTTLFQNNDSNQSGKPNHVTVPQTYTDPTSKIYKMFDAVYPPPDTLRDGDERYLSETYYVDTRKKDVVVYDRKLQGVFQSRPIPSPTLRSVLEAFGVSYGSLQKLTAVEASRWEEESNEIERERREGLLKNMDEPVPDGHYMLIPGFTFTERGSWQMRVDRETWIYQFDQFAYKKFFHELTCKKPRDSYDRPIRNTKCTFSGDDNSNSFIIHFLIRLRMLEMNWKQRTTVQVIKKLQSSQRDGVCFFCGQGSSFGAPFCSSHYDLLLTQLFSRLVATDHWKKEYIRDSEQEKLAKREQLARADAKLVYEGRIRKDDQYRYLDHKLPAVQKHLTKYKHKYGISEP